MLVDVVGIVVFCLFASRSFARVCEIIGVWGLSNSHESMLVWVMLVHCFAWVLGVAWCCDIVSCFIGAYIFEQQLDIDHPAHTF